MAEDTESRGTHEPEPDNAGLTDARPHDLDDEPATRRLRRRPNFRGHIVVENDELPAFDTPADPPPAPPAAPDGQLSQG